MIFNKKEIEKILYIRLLRYGYDHPNGFPQQQLESELSLTEGEKLTVNDFFSDAANDGFTNSGTFSSHTLINRGVFYCLKNREEGTGTALFMLNHEAFFNYQNYLNYLQSDKQSKVAFWISIISMIVSIFTLCLTNKQINISKEQLGSPIEIKQSQIQEIKESMESVYFFEK